MTPYICLLILLIMTLISPQRPLPLLHSDVAETERSNLQAYQYKPEETRNIKFRIKRQAMPEVSEDQQNNEWTHGNEKEKLKGEKDRNKRLETEDNGCGNQFYKPLNEETKGLDPIDGSKQSKGNMDKNVQNNDLSSIKLSAPRPFRQAPSPSEESANIRPNGRLDNSKHLNGGEIQPVNTVKRIDREIPGIEKLSENHYLSSETLETIKKINPLTIGDQVSQMIHDRKCKLKSNKPVDKEQFGSGPGHVRQEDEGNVPPGNGEVLMPKPGYFKLQPPHIVHKPIPSIDYGTATLSDENPIKSKISNHRKNEDEEDIQQRSDDEPKPLPTYIKQQPPHIVHKPLPSIDYGLSRGLTVNEPRKSMPNNDLNTNGDKTLGWQWSDASKVGGSSVNRFGTNTPKKEERVEKRPNPNVEFPVYDDDLTEVPDPFHGLLDPTDGANLESKEGNTLGLGGAKVPFHNIHVRNAQKGNNDENSFNDTSRPSENVVTNESLKDGRNDVSQTSVSDNSGGNCQPPDPDKSFSNKDASNVDNSVNTGKNLGPDNSEVGGGTSDQDNSVDSGKTFSSDNSVGGAENSNLDNSGQAPVQDNREPSKLDNSGSGSLSGSNSRMTDKSNQNQDKTVKDETPTSDGTANGKQTPDQPNQDTDNGNGNNDLETFEDKVINLNKTKCLSWNDNVFSGMGCGGVQETPQPTESTEYIETSSVCDSGTSVGAETNNNKTCCLSWKDKGPNNNNASLLLSSSF